MIRKWHIQKEIPTPNYIYIEHQNKKQLQTQQKYHIAAGGHDFQFLG